MSSDQMETEQPTTNKSVGTRDLVEHLDALDKCGFKHLCRNYKLLKKTGGNFEVVKAFLEAEDKTRQAQKEERKKRRTQEESSSSSSSSEEEKPWKKEKREKKEHKKNSKVFKKIQKKDRKEYRNSKSKANDRSINPAIIDLTGNAWPAEGTNLYLDGNNMLFVLGPIRKMALQGQRSEAESVLQGLAEEFAKKMGLTQCTLIYDNTNKSVTTASFVVCSARPQFATSDDALVEWASQPGGKGLYVTSDCGLIERLAAVGSSICKPKQWFAFVANTLSGGQVDSLDGWVQTWIDKRAASITNNNAM